MAHDHRGSYRPPSPCLGRPTLRTPARPPSPGFSQQHPSLLHPTQQGSPGQRYQAGLYGPGGSGGGGGYPVHALGQAGQPPRPQSTIGYSQPQMQYGMPMAYGSPPTGAGTNGFGVGLSPVSLSVFVVMCLLFSGRQGVVADRRSNSTSPVNPATPFPPSTYSARPSSGSTIPADGCRRR